MCASSILRSQIGLVLPGTPFHNLIDEAGLLSAQDRPKESYSSKEAIRALERERKRDSVVKNMYLNFS